MKKIITILLVITIFQAFISAQSMYFPPATGTVWETVTPQSLGWCTQNIDSLNRFLEEKNSKTFIVLKNNSSIDISDLIKGFSDLLNLVNLMLILRGCLSPFY